jgi:hypothetical protein
MLFDNNKNQSGVFGFLILRIGWFSGYAEPRRNVLFWETRTIFYVVFFSSNLSSPPLSATPSQLGQYPTLSLILSYLRV